MEDELFSTHGRWRKPFDTQQSLPPAPKSATAMIYFQLQLGMELLPVRVSCC